jgi:hypothetical protein|tara:strand:+ start:711 stop:1145 length:435 start_codon:yes stop_codon:yes gene_type:complete
MAHFAKISLNSKVLTVLTLNNEDMLNDDGVEDETVGQQYLERHNNHPAEMWIQTSYNTSNGTHNSGDNSKALRGNYAGIGYTWDKDNNIFYSKKPYPSWVLNTTTATWHSPIGNDPDDLTDEEKALRIEYVWNEDGQSWDKTTR